MLCSSPNKLQQNSDASSREEYVPPILTLLLEIHRVYILPSWPFVFCVSFVNGSWNNVTTPSTNQLFWPDSGQILRHQYGISVAESQTLFLAKRPQRRRARSNGCFRRLKIYEDFFRTLETVRNGAGVRTGVASYADVLRGSSRVPAPRTTFVGQERVMNLKERLRGRLVLERCP